MNFFKKNYDKNLYNHVKGGTVGQIVNFILFIVFYFFFPEHKLKLFGYPFLSVFPLFF